MTQHWVLVTGGARRLGQSFCMAFARAGWGVVCHYQSSADEAAKVCDQIRALGMPVATIQGDLSRADEREALFAAAKTVANNNNGSLHALINNASSFEPDEGMDFTPELLDRQLGVNLVAPLHLSRLMAQASQAKETDDFPCVVHVLDQKVFNLNPDYFSYTVSKLALESSVALQAQAFAPHVRVCGLAPGLIYVSGPQAPDNFEKSASVNLLRSPTAPEDVARTAVFMAENNSINGVTVCVDKGQHLVPLERDIMFVAEQLARR